MVVVMIVSKVIYDNKYSNQFLSIVVPDMSSWCEKNQMEREIYSYLASCMSEFKQLGQTHHLTKSKRHKY